MCNATTKKGLPCKNIGHYDGYCHLHRAPRINQDYRYEIISENDYFQRSPLSPLQPLTQRPPLSPLQPLTQRPPLSPLQSLPQGPRVIGFDEVAIDVDNRQNVHQANLNKQLNGSTKYLVEKYNVSRRQLKLDFIYELNKVTNFYTKNNNEILKNPKPEHYVKKTYDLCLFKYTRVIEDPTMLVKKRNIRFLEFFNVINTNGSVDFYILLVAVVKHIFSFPQNLYYLLIDRLVDEVLEGKKYCAHGKRARLINVFTGIDSQIDSRSQNEIIQDKMSEISKLDVNQREKVAEDFFKNIKISEEEKQVWIDALLE